MSDELDKPISEIEPIEATASISLLPGDFSKFIEPPCLSAVTRLYDCGIGTLASTANRKNIEIGNTGNANIIIEMDGLCSVNDQKIRALASRRPQNVIIESNELWGNYAVLSVPIDDPSITGREISDKFNQLLDEAKFLKQPAYGVNPIKFDTFIQTARLPADPVAGDPDWRTNQELLQMFADVCRINVSEVPGMIEKYREGEVYPEFAAFLCDGRYYDAESDSVYDNKELCDYYKQSKERAEPGTSTQIKSGRSRTI